MPHPPFPLLHLDQQLAVISKPAGWLVHPSPIDRSETRVVVSALRDQLGRKVYPLHRLDKATSGVLAFALNAEAAREFGVCFESGIGVRKTYRAVVRGWPSPDQLIDHPLDRMPDDFTPRRDQALPAQTRLRTLRCGALPIAHGRYPEIRFAEVEVEPLTGRRHQIRRHLKHIAHPVIGDSTHGKGPLNRAVADHLGVARLWLHASALQILAPGAAAPMLFEAAPGPEWALWSQAYMPACDTNLMLR